MLNKILTISLQNRFMVLLGAVILSITGLYIARTMNVDVFPDLTAPTVTILTEAYGMESVEVLHDCFFVSYALAGLPQTGQGN